MSIHKTDRPPLTQHRVRDSSCCGFVLLDGRGCPAKKIVASSFRRLVPLRGTGPVEATSCGSYGRGVSSPRAGGGVGVRSGPFWQPLFAARGILLRATNDGHATFFVVARVHVARVSPFHHLRASVDALRPQPCPDTARDRRTR